VLDLENEVTGRLQALVQKAVELGTDKAGIRRKLIDTIADQIITSGKAEHTYLGIKGQPLNTQLAQAFNIPTNHGVLVESVVPNSPAAKAGLRGGTTSATIDGMPYMLGGDVITAVDGEKLLDETALSVELLDKKPGEQVTLRVYRAGKPRDVRVRLGTRPSETGVLP
jgi:2-alkenal reductase